MIYDCCIYNNEEHLLRIAVEEFRHIQDVVHIVVGCSHTFTGIEKQILPLPKWMDDCDNLQLYSAKFQFFTDPWMNEAHQRNSIKEFINPHDDDIIIIRDADEIPRWQAVSQYVPEMGSAVLLMDQYYYYLNTLATRQNWRHAKIMTGKDLKDSSPEEIRNAGCPFAMLDAGWHFSYTGGVDTMLEKFISFSHQEDEVQKVADAAILQHKLNSLESLWGTDKLQIVSDNELPEFVRNNLFSDEHGKHV